MIIITGPKGDRHVKAGKPYRLEPGERVSGSTMEQQRDQLDNIGNELKTGVGDLVNAVTTATGFKKWWIKHHKGSCLPCQKRQAALNYFQFKGLQWVHDWVEEKQEDKMNRELAAAGKEEEK